MNYSKIGTSTMYLARTRLFGDPVEFKADTIEEIASWAEHHNLEFVEGAAPNVETFEVFAGDASPLNPEAIARLSRCKFRVDSLTGIELGEGWKNGQLKRMVVRVAQEELTKIEKKNALFPNRHSPSEDCE